MIINELHIKGFGKWKNRTFRFAPGLNLFIAGNEAGKTTLLNALIASLYGLKRDYVRVTRYLPEYEQYLPWDGGPYETIVQYQLAEQQFRLQRVHRKEQEQARLFREPELLEITHRYQEDKRKEYNFLESHLGLSRTLFTDLTWINREPLQAADYLSSSIVPSEQQPDPLANQILAAIDQELTLIGKKDTGGTTLWGKAARQAAEAKQTLVAAEQAWREAQAIQEMSGQWQEQLIDWQRQRERMVSQLNEREQQASGWQERWQRTFQLKSPDDLLVWETEAGEQWERQLYRQVREAWEQQERQQDETADASADEAVVREVEAAYLRGWQLLKELDRKREQLLQAGGASARPRWSQKRAKTNGRKRLAIAGGVLTALFAGLAWWQFSRQQMSWFFFFSVLTVGSMAGWLWRSLGWGKRGEPAKRAGQLQQLERELNQVTDQLAALLDEWKVPDWDAFLALREQWKERLHRAETGRLSKEAATVRERENRREYWISEIRRQLEAQMASCDEQKKLLQDKLWDTEEQIAALREKIAKAQGEMGQWDQLSLAKARSEYEQAAAAVEQLLLRRDALLLAKECLLEAVQQWQRNLAPGINRRASQIMATVTANRYRDVRLDPSDKFAVRVVSEEQQRVALQTELSTGTSDQLYFAQRLALLLAVSEQTGPLPIFLDDHFIHYDEQRLSRTLAYLVKLSERHQIFLFSCHQREWTVLQPFLQGNERHLLHEL
ncbi:ATP-binding protein [Brevibacillus fulvus]|uniref:Uncharacterized protein YhaN n=1 Tax=Brevibacillus fulvus TaxID=1125967 RepID=A0A939BTP4_9BACL|nr:AAA family ATPase [Brevibacillus fulvus]MBM7592037.1 uncharacterized protein YhaN [Brevibacillus fulvus]